MTMNRIKRVALPLFGATALIAVAGCANLSDDVFQRPALLMSCSEAPHRAAHLTQALRIE